MVFKKRCPLNKRQSLKRESGTGAVVVVSAPKMNLFSIFFFSAMWQKLFGMLFAYGIKTPTSIANLLGPWLRGFSPNLRKQILVGAAALSWALWLTRNDATFNRSFPNSCLQVIFRGTYWTRFWSHLSKEEEKNLIKKQCLHLEGLALEVFSRSGWNFRSRIECKVFKLASVCLSVD